MSEIRKTSDPEATLANFKETLAKANSPEKYEAFRNSGFKVFKRDDAVDLETQFRNIAKHFGLDAG